MRRAAAIAVAVGFSTWVTGAPGASPSPAPSPSVRWLPGDPMQLELKPHGARTWKEHVIDITVTLAAGKEPVAERKEHDRSVTRTVAKHGVALELIEEPGKHGVRVSPRGLPLDAAGARPMELVLPEKKLAARTEFLGQRTYGKVQWSTEAPASEQFPMPIKTEFDLTGTEVSGGVECLAIAMTAKAIGMSKDGKTRVEYWGRGRVLYDPVEGVVRASTREVRTDAVAWPVPKTGRLRVHRELLSTGTLVP